MSRYDFYDAIYQQKKTRGETGWVSHDSENWRIHVAAIERTLNADYCPESGAALDLGCGAGDFSFVLADHGFAVTGVDLSPTAIGWAREKDRNRQSTRGSARFIHANIVELDQAGSPDVGSSYQFILDGFLLHCLLGPDRHRYLRTAQRLLAPEGVFLVQTFCAENLDDPGWARWRIDRPTRQQLDSNGKPIKHLGNRKSILEDIEAAGLQPIEDEMIPIAGGMLQVATRRG